MNFLKTIESITIIMKRNFAGPPIMKDEIQAAIRKMKSSKTTGPGSVLMVVLLEFEDYGVDKVGT